MMEKPLPTIKSLRETLLVGKRMTMSLANNKTKSLWQSTRPLLNAVSNRCSDDLISMQLYPADYFASFNPSASFEKWATAEVSSFDMVPDGLELFTIPPGIYAVFQYRGASNDPTIFQYIFSEWLPRSSYALDDRPHFELLGKKYKNNDPDSEEEIWIPIKAVNP